MSAATQSQEEENGPPPLLRVRLIDLQINMSPYLESLRHCYAPPHEKAATSFPDAYLPKKVPCIRIFGHTPANQSVCLNIHGIWPYLFIDYPEERSLQPDAVNRWCKRIALSLNTAMCQTLRQDEYGIESRSGAGGPNTNTFHVASVMLVKGTPFYGYHVGNRHYLKISLVSPSQMQRAAGLLGSGEIMKRKWVVYETHLATKLQFMIDFDLYGCGWVDLSGGYFRGPLPEKEMVLPGEEKVEGLITEDVVDHGNLHSELHAPPKETWSELEIDVLPYHILNRKRLKPRYLHDSLHEYLDPELIDPNAKFVRSVRELWAEEERRRISKGLDPKEGMVPSTIDDKRMGGFSQVETGWKGGDWDASPRWWQLFVDRLSNERRRKDFQHLKLDTLGLPSREDHKMWDQYIMTTYESVEGGWPKNERSVKKQGVKSVTRSQRERVRADQASSPLKGMSNGTAKGALTEAIDDDDNEEEEQDDAGLNKWEEQYLACTQRPPEEEAKRTQEILDEISITEDMRQAIEDQDRQWQAKQDAAVLEHLDGDINRPGGEGSDDGYADGEHGFDEEDNVASIPRLTQIMKLRSEGGLLETPLKDSQRRWSQRSPTVTPTKGPNGGYAPKTPTTPQTHLSPSHPFRSGSTSTIGDRTPHGHLKEEYGKSPFERARTRSTNGGSVTPGNRAMKPGKGRNLRSPTLALASSNGKGLSKDHDGDSDFASDGVISEGSQGDEVEPVKKLRFQARVDYERSRTSQSEEEMDMVPPAAQMSHDPSTSSSLESLNGRKRTFDELMDDDPEAGSESDDIMEATWKNASDLETEKEPTAMLQIPMSLESTETSSQEKRPGKKTRFDIDISPPPSQLSQVEKIPSKTSILSGPSDGTKSDEIPSHLLERGSWTYALPPPSNLHVLSTMEKNGQPSIVYQQPFFSIHKDAKFKPKDFGTQTFRTRTNGVVQLAAFGHEWTRRKNRKAVKRKRVPSKNVSSWTYADVPPSSREVNQWGLDLAAKIAKPLDLKAKNASQWGGPTQKNKYGFVIPSNKKSANSQRERQSMSVMALEVFATSRGRLLPDPEQDPVVAIFYCLQDDSIDRRPSGSQYHALPPEYPGSPGYRIGVMLLKDKHIMPKRININEVLIEYFDSENDLLQEIISRVRIWNPDVLAGYEVHASSWGFLSSRAHHYLSMDFSGELSRVRSGASGRGGHSDYNRTHTSLFQVSGRQVFNIWRIMRGELTLGQYTFEHVAFELLHERIPQYPPRILTEWYNSRTSGDLVRNLQYHIMRVNLYMGILDKAEVVTKNAEFARVFGVDFDSVMSRGSQFKVESFMFRIAKPESFLLISPTREEVGKQNTAEAQPLIFEPDSRFYTDPVVVLDFQSLYPSIMIGYNYCYSTCLGRVEKFQGEWKLGWRNAQIPAGELEALQDLVTISPNGIIYAKPHLRKSLLAKMLTEILETRVMVKQGMKLHKGDKGLGQVLNARQLGLKLMANVTYGYCGASFSGRMPCVEIADSIVQTGRETLEKAITMIEQNPTWGAKVVYGDTDSLFVHLPGKTKDQAFRFGNEMAEAVTAVNPKPVKLKFEKVYTKCLLMAKKRYVGFKLESIDEKEPVFDAKGIETVRRDGFPAQQKMVETVIKMLFRTQDLSLIKRYCVDQWTKLKEGKVSIQDFTFAKEVKMGSYSENGVPLPGAIVAGKKLVQDPRAEAEYGERVPYVVAVSEKRRLAEKSYAPEEMLNNRDLKLDAEYYITRGMLNALNRILNLVGVDCKVWYDQMPKVIRANNQYRSVGVDKIAKSGKGGFSLDSHFTSVHCLVCGQKTDKKDICDDCRHSPSTSVHTLMSRFHLAEDRLLSAHRICASCSSTPLTEQIRCESLACPVLYARFKAGWEADDLAGVPRLVEEIGKKEEVIEIE